MLSARGPRAIRAPCRRQPAGPRPLRGCPRPSPEPITPDLFAAQAAIWDTRPLPQPLSEGIAAAIAARIVLEPTWTVLAFGARTGLLTGHLATKVRSVLAVDVSPAMLAPLAAKPALQDRVEPACRDLLVAPLDRRVDLIVSALAMHHVEDTARLLRTLYAHLVHGGPVALADLDSEAGDFHPPGVGGGSHHGFDRAALAGQLRDAGFVDVAIETACVVDRDGRRYGVFLAPAARRGP
ncbi:MAG: class I SAM-dependent methyltransferase [Deltaproteobacteria bacterium]|nr:class I SAM-dependent methyltransferase [Deltaproteobacteria bacterium]